MTPKPKKTDAPQKPPADMMAPEEPSYKLLSTDLIDDPEQPMRTDMTPATVEDLVLSIKQVGIIEPLVVKPKNARYEVIAGHRRLYASKLARVPEVPCYVRPANNEQTEMLKIHENLYRAEIKPADEAKHYDYLIQKHGMTPTKISQMVGKALSYVTDRLNILEYPSFLREALDNKEISFSVAREFRMFDDLKQMQIAVFYAKRGGMTTELARKWVQDHKRSQETPTLQETPPTNGYTEPEPVEHTAYCVYCQGGLRLVDAEVVYMHTKCLKDVRETQQTELANAAARAQSEGTEIPGP